MLNYFYNNYTIFYRRTVHSLLKLLVKFQGIKFQFVAPEELNLPIELVNELINFNIEFNLAISLEEAILNTDVLYMTRIQKERFAIEADYLRIANSYCLDMHLMMKVISTKYS